MNLQLIRKSPMGQCVFGTLSIDNQPECFTLERLEVQIPVGTYPIEITYSPRFSKPLPLLDSVPDRTDIRIHSGNWPRDTEGCIIVGQTLGDNMILSSLAALDPLVAKIQLALDKNEPLSITIS